MTEEMFNKVFGRNLTQMMEERGISQNELARQLDVSPTSVNNWCNGLKTPRMKMVDKICAFFGVRRADLINSKPPAQLSPVYEAAAGKGIISSAPVDTINMHLRPDQSIAIVKGSSMEPTLQDGDKVVIDAQSVLDYDGQIALVKVNGEENTLKRVQIKKDGLLLVGDNTSVYSPTFYTTQEVNDLPVQIMGVVSALIRELK